MHIILSRDNKVKLQLLLGQYLPFTYTNGYEQLKYEYKGLVLLLDYNDLIIINNDKVTIVKDKNYF